MNEWDELLEHIEEHKDDPVPESEPEPVPQDDMYWAELGKDPHAYAIRLMQTAWDLRLPREVQSRAKVRLFHLCWGEHERMG